MSKNVYEDETISANEDLGDALSLPFSQLPQQAMTFPFDVAREIYAKTVQAGLLQSSILASRNVANALDAAEKATLGPWARKI